MKNQIGFVKVAKTLDEVGKLSFFTKRLTGERLVKKLSSKMPMNITEMNIDQFEGYNIVLPIILNEEKTLEENYIKEVIEEFNQFIYLENIGVLILDRELLDYKEYFRVPVVDENYLKVLYIGKIVEEFASLKEVHTSDLRIAIAYSDQNILRFVINEMIDKVKSIMILSNEIECLHDYVQDIYYEYGLAIELRDDKVKANMDVDLLIDCDKHFPCNYHNVPDGATVISCFRERRFISSFKSKRKSLNFLYEIDVGNPKYSNEWLLGKMMLDNRGINRMVSGKGRDKMISLISRYLENQTDEIQLKIL